MPRNSDEDDFIHRADGKDEPQGNANWLRLTQIITWVLIIGAGLVLARVAKILMTASS